MIVPKRAAMLLDRIMVALHHALENEGEVLPNELEKDKVSKMNPRRKIIQQYILQQQRRPKEMASGIFCDCHKITHPLVVWLKVVSCLLMAGIKGEDSQLLDNMKDYDVDLNDSADLVSIKKDKIPSELTKCPPIKIPCDVFLLWLDGSRETRSRGGSGTQQKSSILALLFQCSHVLLTYHHKPDDNIKISWRNIPKFFCHDTSINTFWVKREKERVSQFKSLNTTIS